MNDFVTDGNNVFVSQFVSVDLKTFTADDAYNFVNDDIWSREIFMMWLKAQQEVHAMDDARIRYGEPFCSFETIQVRDCADEPWIQRVFMGYDVDNNMVLCRNESLSTHALVAWRMARRIPE